MKLYFSVVLGIYVLLSVGLYLALDWINLGYIRATVGCSFAGALMYHLYMESIIGMDDYDEKTTFREFVKDFWYCFAVGMIAFISIALAIVGFGLMKSEKHLVGFLLIILAVIFVIVTHSRKSA